jgi:hypothetical protein
LTYWPWLAGIVDILAVDGNVFLRERRAVTSWVWACEIRSEMGDGIYREALAV